MATVDFSRVKRFIKYCDVCNSVKELPIRKAPVQNHVLGLVSMDILGPFQNGVCVLNIVDHFSRFLQLYTLKSMTANSVVDALFQ